MVLLDVLVGTWSDGRTGEGWTLHAGRCCLRHEPGCALQLQPRTDLLTVVTLAARVALLLRGALSVSLDDVGYCTLRAGAATVRMTMLAFRRASSRGPQRSWLSSVCPQGSGRCVGPRADVVLGHG